MAEVFLRAREADSESAFGGIVSVTEVVDEALAARLNETFLEVVVAPGYSPEALELLGKKKRVRLLEIPQPVRAVVRARRRCGCARSPAGCWSSART